MISPSAARGFDSLLLRGVGRSSAPGCELLRELETFTPRLRWNELHRAGGAPAADISKVAAKCRPFLASKEKFRNTDSPLRLFGQCRSPWSSGYTYAHSEHLPRNRAGYQMVPVHWGRHCRCTAWGQEVRPQLALQDLDIIKARPLHPLHMLVCTTAWSQSQVESHIQL